MSRGPRVNCLVRGATASFSQASTRASDDNGGYLVVARRRFRGRDHDSVTVRYLRVELASFADKLQTMSNTCHRRFRPKSGFPTVTLPHQSLATPATSATGLENCDCVLERLGKATNEKANLCHFSPHVNLLFSSSSTTLPSYCV